MFQDEAAPDAESLQEDVQPKQIPFQDSSSTLPFAAKNQKHSNQASTQSMKGSIERIEQQGRDQDVETSRPKGRKMQQEKPETQNVLERPVEMEQLAAAVEPSPKLRYETAMVHMSDCPTIRADCVSSNQIVVNWTFPSERQECRLECRNVAEHNAVTSSVKKRRNRNRQKSLPAERLDDCIYATDGASFYPMIPVDNSHIVQQQQQQQLQLQQQQQQQPLSTNGFQSYSPPPPVPAHYNIPDPAMMMAPYDPGNVVVGDTCWQYEKRRSKSCQRMNKKRMSVQAEAIQLDDEPPPPPPPPVFCGPEMFECVIPPPMSMMTSCENDDIVAVVEDHRHRERRRPPMPPPQPKPRTIFQTNIVPRSRSKSSSNLLSDRRTNHDAGSNTTERRYRYRC